MVFKSLSSASVVRPMWAWTGSAATSGVPVNGHWVEYGHEWIEKMDRTGGKAGRVGKADSLGLSCLVSWRHLMCSGPATASDMEIWLLLPAPLLGSHLVETWMEHYPCLVGTLARAGPEIERTQRSAPNEVWGGGQRGFPGWGDHWAKHLKMRVIWSEMGWGGIKVRLKINYLE